jgi:hypothetical protein
MSNTDEIRFSVVIDQATAATGLSLDEAITQAKREAAQARDVALICRSGGEIALVVHPGGRVAVDVQEVPPPRGTLLGGASWPVAHPLTGEPFVEYEGAGSLPAVDCIFRTESRRHLRGRWGGIHNPPRQENGWHWDVDYLLAEHRERSA